MASPLHDEENAPVDVAGAQYAPVSFPNALHIKYTNLTVTGKRNTKKKLLHKLNGSFNGGLWGILGSSGSGKTTLLSTLAQRIDTSFSIDGDIVINNTKVTKALIKAISGYVMQDDLLHAHLTCYEVLLYTALLRLPHNLSYQEKITKINKMVDLMMLQQCINTIVGDSRQKGVSGGERKRLCVAMELLIDPQILFLDEPTSGLDSATSYSLCNILCNIANTKSTTVICTIHQPTAKTFSLFHNLILMKEGRIVYQGCRDKIQAYLTHIGCPCDVNVNIADHILDMLVPLDKSSTNCFDQASFVYDAPVCVDAENSNILEKLRKQHESFRPSWLNQFSVLFQRNFRENLRNYPIFLLNVAATSLIAVFAGESVWQSVGTNKLSVGKRMNALFFCVIHQGIVASLQGIHSFPMERNLMLRERASGSYYISAYFLARTLSDMLFVQLIPPIVFTCFVYPLVGFQCDPSNYGKYFVFSLFMILASFAASSLANMVSCVCKTIELSGVILAACYEITRLYGGWFISPALLKLYPRWKFVDALSYIKYVFIGISLNENYGLKVQCGLEERTPPFVPHGSKCIIPPLMSPPYTGERLNQFYGYDEFTITGCVLSLLMYILCCRIIAYLALRFFVI